MTKIETKQEYYAAMAEIEGYLQKGLSNLSEVEDKRLEELSIVVEAWEIQVYPMPLQSSIQDLLNYIMRQRNLTQNVLSEELEISKSQLSEILNGKKKPNVTLLRSLHNKYQLDGNMLLEIA